MLKNNNKNIPGDPNSYTKNKNKGIINKPVFKKVNVTLN